MKKVVLALFTLLICMKMGNAQDLITGKDGAIAKVKIIKVTSLKVFYLMYDSLNGPTYSKLLEDVISIQYENGRKDSSVFAPNANSSLEVNYSAFNEDLYAKGKMDAKRYYKVNPGGAASILALTMVNPLLGLIPAAAFSRYSSDEDYLNPNIALMRKYDYKAGYTTEASSIKKRKKWMLYGIGLGINIAIYATFISHH